MRIKSLDPNEPLEHVMNMQNEYLEKNQLNVNEVFTVLAAALALQTIFLIIAVITVICLCCKKKKQKPPEIKIKEQKDQPSSPIQWPKELRASTNIETTFRDTPRATKMGEENVNFRQSRPEAIEIVKTKSVKEGAKEDVGEDSVILDTSPENVK